MLLLSVIFFLATTKSIAIALSKLKFNSVRTCPYQSLASDAWRGLLLGFHNDNRRVIATEDYGGIPKAKQMNEMAWNCDTEYNLSKMQLELNSNDTVVYRNFGVNIGLGEADLCDFDYMYYVVVNWVRSQNQFPTDLLYNGDPSILQAANADKWNSTEMACAYRSFDNGNSFRLICAYNVKADVIGQPIYEAGNGTCSEGDKCGNDGTCVKDLCRVPTTYPGLSRIDGIEPFLC
ncbi:unnamed protein product [Nippostrongylus brasiliensis]|uniref:SCP domain-containing protein n=1 Tax=Nippostrongylus brasiliensis TaxID=27835 RepID=A0A0N4Y925_NIPBR|nr:unnamed protein product [Nippostrongylus brasiliensis]